MCVKEGYWQRVTHLCPSCNLDLCWHNCFAQFSESSATGNLAIYECSRCAAVFTHLDFQPEYELVVIE